MEFGAIDPRVESPYNTFIFTAAVILRRSHTMGTMAALRGYGDYPVLIMSLFIFSIHSIHSFIPFVFFLTT